MANRLKGIWSVPKRGPLASVAFIGFAHLLQVIKHGLRKSSVGPGSSTAALPEPGSALNQTGRHHELKIVK